MSVRGQTKVGEIDQKLADKSQLISQLAIERVPLPKSKSPKYKQAGVVVAVIAGVLLVYVFTSNGEILPTTEPGLYVEPVQIPVEQPESRIPSAKPAINLEAIGYVVAHRIATVGAQATGEISEIRFDEGTAVSAGDILALLKDHEQQANFDLAQAQLAKSQLVAEEESVVVRFAQSAFRRGQILWKRGVISDTRFELLEQEIDRAKARYKVAEGQVQVAMQRVQLAKVALDQMIIRAPFSGVVINKAAHAGEIVSPMSAGGGFTRTGIGTIVDMQSLEVEVDINEGHISRVYSDQPVEISLNAYPEGSYRGRVLAVIPTADRNKATIRVRIAIIDKDSRVLPQMGVRVAFLDTEEGRPFG